MAGGKGKRVYTPSPSNSVTTSSDAEEEFHRHTPGRAQCRLPTTPSTPVARLAIDLNLISIASPLPPTQHSGTATAGPSQTQHHPTPAVITGQPSVDALLARRRLQPPLKTKEHKWYAVARGKTVGIVLNWNYAKSWVLTRSGRLARDAFVVSFDEMADAMEILQAADFEQKMYPIFID
ncbi:hypothetical protein BDN72DRAFT_894663 [Pluteus cervinus]|uniref:Uncharacterized protein n=1 Tax=Pluteus cervinus TaxID=181527 RepID=A0ACD3B388_9AGAR|nr:hypothetical protein BDN72DRAFT_894663 [Pluteus cervinus]